MWCFSFSALPRVNALTALLPGQRTSLNQQNGVFSRSKSAFRLAACSASRRIAFTKSCVSGVWMIEMEKEKPGTYNARRNNLRRVWGKLFGYRHRILIVSRFYEVVERPDKKVVLEFDPTPVQQMLVACLWNHTTTPEGEDLYSFAAITDEPPPEVAVAGHDRCIVPIKAEHVDAWLNPDPSNLAALYAILDDRERPYYEHRLADAA